MQDDLFLAPPPQLLAIVEVDRDDRVVCQADGCGHTVYKRIHVARIDGKLQVYGSDCFGRLYGKAAATSTPAFGTSDGKKLTAEERQMLADNTEAFIAHMEQLHLERLETERRAQEERERARLDQLEAERQSREQLAATRRIVPEPIHLAPTSIGPPMTEALSYSGPKWDAARAKAKELLSKSSAGIDWNSPGWSGMLIVEARRLFREM